MQLATDPTKDPPCFPLAVASSAELWRRSKESCVRRSLGWVLLALFPWEMNATLFRDRRDLIDASSLLPLTTTCIGGRPIVPLAFITEVFERRVLVRGIFSLFRHRLFLHLHFVSLTETFSGNNGINFPGIRRKSETHYPALENTFADINLPSHELKQNLFLFPCLSQNRRSYSWSGRKVWVGHNSHPPIASLNQIWNISGNWPLSTASTRSCFHALTSVLHTHASTCTTRLHPPLFLGLALPWRRRRRRRQKSSIH